MVLNRFIVSWQRRLAAVVRSGVVLGALFGATTGAGAQTAAEHAAQAHGSPIVDGRNIEPSPNVVEERLRHLRQQRRAEEDEAVGSPSSPVQLPDLDKAPAASGASASKDEPRNISALPQPGVDTRDTEQICHDLLHGGKKPANAASNPQRCE